MTSNDCSSATRDLSVEEMISLIASSPPGPWPDGWASWPNVNEAHRVMARRFAETLKPSRHVFERERGIVIAGGGLGSHGLVGEGAAECERRWDVNTDEGKTNLTLSRLDRPTCHLEKESDGVWRGRWLEYERMPVELIPLED